MNFQNEYLKYKARYIAYKKQLLFNRSNKIQQGGNGDPASLGYVYIYYLENQEWNYRGLNKATFDMIDSETEKLDPYASWFICIGNPGIYSFNVGACGSYTKLNKKNYEEFLTKNISPIYIS